MGKPDKSEPELRRIEPAPPSGEPEPGSPESIAAITRSFPDKQSAAARARAEAEAKRREGGKDVAAAAKAVKQAEQLGKTALDKFSGGWKDAKEVSDPSFRAGEKLVLTGNSVNFRKADEGDSGVLARLNRNAEFTVADDPAKSGQPKILEKNGERFVLVKDTKDRVGYVAAAYLKPFPERVAATKERRGSIEISDASMFRELIIHQLEKKFPGDENTAKRDQLYTKWDQGYQWIMRTKRDQPSRDEALQRLYENMNIFEEGAAPDLYADKVKMELEFALGARRAGATVEVPAGIKNPEDALNDALAKLGYEIGIYYGKGRMSVEQIRTAFNIQGVADSHGNKWGEPGSRVVFNYTDGRIYFYPPESKKEMRTVAVIQGAEHRLRYTEEAPGGVRQEEYDAVMERARKPEKQLMRVEEKELAMRRPQDPEMAQLSAQRSREYTAALQKKQAKEAGV
ncbi:SH3 domain-containing protein [Candidatus Peregrinibacteria bacterium]|nr:SH3 domain-containing protein [Candidatus Peregrinibacteria bacterium]